MDDCDRARQYQDAHNQQAAAYRRPVPAIKPLGWCHACGADMAGLALFCDAACANEYERMERQR